MRIIHTSDWHLGQYFYGKSRAPEHKQFITWLLAQVKEHGIDALIIAGDVFDTGSPPSYARELYFDFITQLNQYQCQLVVVAGNHDSTAMLAESKQLLKKLNVHVVPTANIAIEEQVFVVNNKQDSAGAVICAIPFLRPKDILTSQANQSAKQKQQQLQKAIADHYQQLFKQAQIFSNENISKKENDLNKKLPIIATGHLTTVGASTSDSVREIYIGTLEAFPSNAFPDADYIALGHIHKQQIVGKNETIVYSGSPIPLSFDESKQDKKVMLVDFNDGELPLIKALNVPCFQPMAMLKTSLKQVEKDVDDALKQHNLENTTNDNNQGDKILWLDIEIDSGEYKQDIQNKITEKLQNKPIEILLIRRSKNVREKLLQQQEKITLEEITPIDVFTSRLQQEAENLTEDENDRLTLLFKEVLQTTIAEQQENNATPVVK